MFFDNNDCQVPLVGVHSKTTLITFWPFVPLFFPYLVDIFECLKERDNLVFVIVLLLITNFSHTHSKHVELTTANQKTTEELTKIKGELVTKDKQLETTKTQTDKLKQLGRTLKSKNEQLNQEVNR